MSAQETILLILLILFGPLCLGTLLLELWLRWKSNHPSSRDELPPGI